MFRKLAIATAAAALLLTSACTGSSPRGKGAGPGAPGESPTAASQPCDSKLTAATWSGTLPQPGGMPSGSTMAAIVKKGYLTAGVDMSTLYFGYDPQHTGVPQGFDADIVRQIAKAIFGEDGHVQYRVVTLTDPTSGAIPQLNAGTVDVVVRTTTITCSRLKDANFSNPYYIAQQKVLVPSSYPATTSLQDLKGKRVCATYRSAPYYNIVKAIGEDSVVKNVGNALDCLVLLQEGKADAISTDDAILNGMKAQDPKVQITTAPAVSSQPYGILTAKKNTDLAQFVNSVLQNIEADGTWAALYKADLGENPSGTPAVPATYAGG